jgi:hypothetical protein
MDNGSPLWAITTYFNPCGYRRRLCNYHSFRRRLAVPLVTVELSFDGVFALGPADSEILVQLSGGDVMWQKERLLNVALAALPRECQKFTWLDCDVVFENADWPEAASCALDRHAVIQPFSRSRDLAPNADADQCDREHSQAKGEAITRALVTGRVKPDILRLPDKGSFGMEIGLAWAARTDVFRRHSFYDACIMGAGDVAIIAGIMGHFHDFIDCLLMNVRRARHYLNWAEPVYETVHGNIGFCEGTIYHLWHGERKDRQYRQRRIEFAKHDFDPFHDISIDTSGCWRWTTNKPQMHRLVKQYFSSRYEDGRPATSSLIQRSPPSSQRWGK